MNIFDIGIILVLIMFLIVGLKRGVIKEAVSLVAIILVFVLSFSLKGIIGNILCMFLPFFDLDGFVTMNIFIYQFLAFIIVFAVMMSIYEFSLRVSKFLQKVVNATIILWLPSKILGGIVSLLKGYLILFIVFMFLMIPFGNMDIFKNSVCVQYMLNKSPVLSGYANNFVKPFQEVISLNEKIINQKIGVNDANLQALDIMLKYKVVDKHTVENLIEVEKLSTVENIESVLVNY
ncbi:MAG: CvpA family protein [Bacilli bacterium]|nr:CvpA family protein [Bacilli bacterium]MBR6137557.1 CvpA family protein [Bacilli bacterium]